MKDNQWFPHLTKEVVKDALGYKMDAYLVALEGWRRGLKLTWYMDESKKPGHVKKVGKNFHGKIFSLSSDTHTHYFFRSRGDKTTNKALAVCKDKEETKKTLRNAGIPVPQGKEFSSDTTPAELSLYANQLGFPVVLKPTDGSLGKGVYSNIQNEMEFNEALKDLQAQHTFGNYIIEKFHPGREYRIYTVGNKVVAASNRIPANIIGDGKHSIEDLIAQKNKEKKLNPYLATKSISIDFEVHNYIKKKGYTLSSIPAEEEVIYLRGKSNLSAGGDPLDATDELTDGVKQIAIDALAAVPGIENAGLDLIVDPDDDNRGTVIEINPTAEIGFHLFPMEGKSRDVPGAIIDLYFPETQDTPQTSFYFDYASILEPIAAKSAESVEVAAAPAGNTYARRYALSGSVKSLKYRNWIRKQALKRGLHGEAKGLKSGKLLVVIAGNTEEKVTGFKDVLQRNPELGTVEEIREKEWKEPVQIGFRIKLKKRKVIKKASSKSIKKKAKPIEKTE